jgi:hypothetical protein
MVIANDFFGSLQTASGAYLAAFIVSHLTAVFVLGRWALEVDTNWDFAIGAPAGMMGDAWNVRLVPHYSLAVFLLFTHLSCGLRVVLLAQHVSPTAAGRLAHTDSRDGFRCARAASGESSYGRSAPKRNDLAAPLSSPFQVDTPQLPTRSMVKCCLCQHTQSWDQSPAASQCHLPTHASQQRRSLFDYLFGAGNQCRRDSDAERLGRNQFDDQIEFGGLLDGDAAWLRTAQNLVDKIARASEQFRVVWRHR